jgi:hypothetical protein
MYEENCAHVVKPLYESSKAEAAYVVHHGGMHWKRILMCGLTQHMTPYLQSRWLRQANNAELLLLSQSPILSQVQKCNRVLPFHGHSNA